ncbi:MAG: hypothetical protein JW803_00125 [Endomicrobiales bacterium]|nr:hypothetical protein [Endomicrobiales bacterium]
MCYNIPVILDLLFIFSGFFAVVAQTLVIRELLAVYGGNDLSIGIIISQWLLGSAAGSYFFTNNKRISGKHALLISLAAGAVFFAFFIFFSRNIRNILGFLPGQGLSLKAVFISSFFLTVPVGFTIGAQFAAAIKYIKEHVRINVSSAYAWESAGFLAGGLVFTYLFIPFFTPSAIVLACAAVFFLLSYIYAVRNRLLIVIAILCALFLPWTSVLLETSTMKDLYRGYELLETRNTPYSRLDVLERRGEKYFFANGTPLLTLPWQDFAKAEESGLLPLLFHPNPKKVLIIGGSGKPVSSALASGRVSVAYLEPNPFYLELLAANWPEVFSNSKLTTLKKDPRKHVSETKDTYDVIILGIQIPATLSANRYYTKEFFALTKKRLSKGGILALSLPGSLVYIDTAMAELNRTLKDTLKEVFEKVEIIPGDENLIIASKKAISGKARLKSRFDKLKLRTLYISRAYLDHRFNYYKRKWFNEELAKVRRKTVNRDFFPAAMLKSLIYWQSVFAPNTISVYRFASKYAWVLFFIPLLWFLSGRFSLGSVAFTSGFAAMGLMLLAIWALQILRGSVYHWIGALNAVFMAGLAAGAAFHNFPSLRSGLGLASSIVKSFSIKKHNYLFVIETGFCVWIALWWGMMKLNFAGWTALFVFSAGTGLVLGFEFPFITELERKRKGDSLDASAGRMYAFDLLGGWISALFCGTLLIPAMGFEGALLLIFLLKTASLKWLFKK